MTLSLQRVILIRVGRENRPKALPCREEEEEGESDSTYDPHGPVV